MIEIVTHVFAEKLAFYATFLKYQLTSLARHPCGVPVVARVFYVPGDAAAEAVVNNPPRAPWLAVIPAPVPARRMWCRAITRNFAAHTTQADLIWYADADYYFGEGCLNKIYGWWRDRIDQRPIMLFPRLSWITRDHALGDLQIERAATAAPAPVPMLDPAEFKPHVTKMPIGGTFITAGEFARREGYLPDSKWQRDHDLRPFASTRDEVAYRKWMHTKGTILEIPDMVPLYRLRHSVQHAQRV